MSDKKYLCDDSNGNPIHVGDTVRRVGETDTEKIEWGRHRELFGFGYVYGYYVPDYCVKVEEGDVTEEGVVLGMKLG